MGIFRFGPFHLDSDRRLLFRDGAAVGLVPKALELLEVLIAERHRTVGKTDLLERLWPNTVVADNNLTVTMSALRKALGESAAQPRYVQTLSRRGYRFVEDPGPGGVAVQSAEQEELPPSSSSPARLRLRSAGVTEALLERRARYLVGRDAERAHLEASLARALAGTGRVVLVTGEPGIGKTALCESFLESVAGDERLLVMRGRSLEQFGRGEAYLPWLEAWGALASGPRGQGARAVLRRVAPSWCREFPALFPESSEQQGPGVTRDRLLREMGEALAALAAEHPLLIVLEDLHWADAASCDLLRWLCQRSATQRWLVIGTFRSVEAGLLNAPLQSLRREALQHGECDELRLGLLDAGHVAACLTQQFRSNDFPEQLADMLFRRTEGHPLFLTRLLSFLVQRQHVVERSGVWSLTRALDTLELEAPEDVRAMVRRKLDSLDEEARMALAYASVEGHEFSTRVLAELLGKDELLLEERLEPLASLHRLIEALGIETWPDGQLRMRYRFAHALYQNELYAGLVSGRRALLHRRTAELLLAHSEADRSGAERSRLAATLAVHFERGRDLPRAIEFLNLAGYNAHRLCAYAEEERLYQRSAELCEQLPEPERSQQLAVAWMGLGWALHDAGQAARAERVFLDLLERSRRMGHHQVECEALAALCGITFLVGRLQESEAFAEEQRQVAAAHGLRQLELRAIACLTGTGCAGTCRFSEALRRSEETLPEIERSGDKHTRAISSVNLGWAHAFQSRFVEAEAAYVQGLELWRGFSYIMMIECLHALGWVRAHCGRPAAGLATFEEAIELSGQQHIGFHLLRLPDGIGWIRREAGDYIGALAHHRAGIAHARSQNARFLELCFLVELSCDSVELGDLAQAREALAGARALFEAGEFGVFPCYVRRAQLRLLAAQARLALAEGDLPGARAAANALLELAGLDPSAQHQVLAHEFLARAALGQSELQGARAHLRAAAELCERFPMPLLAWRIHALEAELCLLHAETSAAHAAARRARELILPLATELRAAALEASFLGSAPVRRALELPLS